MNASFFIALSDFLLKPIIRIIYTNITISLAASTIATRAIG